MAVKRKKESVSKSKRKSNQSSTPVKPKPRKQYTSLWREEKEARGDYTNQKSVPYDTIKELFKEFKELHMSDLDNPWTRNLTVRRFFLLKGYLPNQISIWARKYPELTDYKVGKMLIGDKREVGIIHKELDGKYNMMQMRHYLDEWKPSQIYKEEWEREDKQRKEDKAHQILMAEKRAQENNAAEELLDYFKGKELVIPELDDSKVKATT